MLQNSPLVTPLVAGLVLAVLLGMIARQLRLPPLIGYVLAGIAVSVPALGLGAGPALGAELAGLGIVLAMFGVGLQFSLQDLKAIRALAATGAVVQLALATALGLGLATIMGWDWTAGMLFGLALSVGSSVLLLQTLRDRRLAQTRSGDIANGWVMAQTLVLVLALVLVPVIASFTGESAGLVHDPFVSFVQRISGVELGLWGALALTLVKIVAFIGFMLIVGQSVIPWALRVSGATGSRELFRLAVLAIGLALALGSATLFGVPLALGAFFAGMMLAETRPSRHAALGTLPLREAFAALLFLGLGMLFDPAMLLSQALPLLAVMLIVIVGKAAVAFAVLVLFRQPVGTALPIAASLAQIGEFSFVVAGMGVALAILPPEAHALIVGGVVLSVVLNPLVFWVAARLQPRLETAPVDATGPRVEPGITPEAPVEPKLAPVDNILEKLAAEAAVVAAVPVAEAVAEALPEPTPPVEPSLAAAETVIELPPPSEAAPVAEDAQPEPAVVPLPADASPETVDTAPEEVAIPLPPPSVDEAPAEVPDVPAAPALEPEDVAAVVDEISEGGPVMPPAEPEPDGEPEIEGALAPDDVVAVSDEISEGGPVAPPAEPEPEIKDTPAGEAAPAVVPEPKS